MSAYDLHLTGELRCSFNWKSLPQPFAARLAEWKQQRALNKLLDDSDRMLNDRQLGSVNRKSLLQPFAARLSEWKQRRALSKLLDYSDRMLDDIGMPRYALHAALALPLSESAGKALAQSRTERQLRG